MKRRTVIFLVLAIITGCTVSDRRTVSYSGIRVAGDPGPEVPEGRDTGYGIRDTGHGSRVTGGDRPVVPENHDARDPRPEARDPMADTLYAIRDAGSVTPGIPDSVTRSSGLPDTCLISRLNYLRANHIEPDMNEPASRKNLFTGRSPDWPRNFITLGKESYLFINFDNDILDYTDRFYTNGIRIELIAPALSRNPAGKIMVPYRGSGKNYYGLCIVQNMYTPSTTKLGGILYGDRPYAAYLYLGSYKITLDPSRYYRQTSELDLGIIGPKSYGEWVQRSFHNAVPTNNEPLGWEYQVQNDLVLDYSLKVEKGVWNTRNAELIVEGSGELGTLYTNMAAGVHFRAGWINPYFSSLGFTKAPLCGLSGLRKFSFTFFAKGNAKLVGYDATLMGGLFNHSSVYTFPGNEIERTVFGCSAGLSIGYGAFRIDAVQNLLSPEFHNGSWHKYVHLALNFCL